MPYLRKNEPTGFWCKWQYFCFFSLFQLYNFIGVRRELKKKNKACRYLESWVCLLSCVKVLRLFLENLDYSVPDAEFIFVFFSTTSPVKTEFFIKNSMDEITPGVTEKCEFENWYESKFITRLPIFQTIRILMQRLKPTNFDRNGLSLVDSFNQVFDEKIPSTWLWRNV